MSRIGLKYAVVDAFTDKVFEGNPAAVIVLEDLVSGEPSIDDLILQRIARGFNLSETAFVTPRTKLDNSGSSSEPIVFGLRWFTPKDEVPICGHATLASAHVLFTSADVLSKDTNLIHFESVSGTLSAKRVGNKVELEFPADLVTPADPQLEQKAKVLLKKAVPNGQKCDISFVGVGHGRSFEHYMLIEVNLPFDLKNTTINPGSFLDLAPDYQVIIITTAVPAGLYPNENIVCLSRVFDPHSGVPEDPVTGSAHCLLGPYWQKNSTYKMDLSWLVGK